MGPGSNGESTTNGSSAALNAADRSPGGVMPPSGPALDEAGGASGWSRGVPRLARRVVATLAPAAALVLLSVLFWDPTLGIIVQGALIGSISALLAVGIALVYRANRIVNFAQGDLGVVPAVLAILLIAPDQQGGLWDWVTGQPYVAGLAIGLVAAVGLGALVEKLFILRFSRALASS
ncbi:MAG: hypothetical protein H0U89_00410 [Acidimicrobiia bacterium]|nr:hypothetical protein [Acidimicrobiia bacterium]